MALNLGDGSDFVELLAEIHLRSLCLAWNQLPGPLFTPQEFGSRAGLHNLGGGPQVRHRVLDVVPLASHHVLDGGHRDGHHVCGGEPQASHHAFDGEPRSVQQELVGVTRAGLAPLVLSVLEKQPGVVRPAFQKILIQNLDCSGFYCEYSS